VGSLSYFIWKFSNGDGGEEGGEDTSSDGDVAPSGGGAPSFGQDPDNKGHEELTKLIKTAVQTTKKTISTVETTKRIIRGSTGGVFSEISRNESSGPLVNYQGQMVSIYRGGNSFEVKSNEVKFNKKTGEVLTTHGVSVNVDPEKVARFGGVYEMISIPEGLEVRQRGINPEHYEIVPAYEMPLEEYQELLNQYRSKIGGRFERECL
jgi:hypothetical protein